MAKYMQKNDYQQRFCHTVFCSLNQIQRAITRRAHIPIVVGFLLGICLSVQFSEFLIDITINTLGQAISSSSSSSSNGLRRLSRIELDKVMLASVLKRLSNHTPTSHELSLVQGHLFVGVLTAKKFLDTRALAIRQTWGRALGNNLVFFSSSGSRSRHDLPLVNLPNVDDSYPPQRKSFLMLQFMLDHILKREHIHWFLRADDDVYVHLPRLEQFLQQLNSSRTHFIGQAGLGRGVEFQRLRFNRNENFCMGGPGVLFSRQTLIKLKDRLTECVQSFASTHEDVELSRCVRSHAKMNCTWSFEMQKLFYHNYSGSISLFDQFDQPNEMKINREPDKIDLNHLHDSTRILSEVITLHPIKQPRKMLLAHEYFLRQQIKQIKQRIWQTKRLLKLVDQHSISKEDSMKSFWNYTEFDLNDLPNFPLPAFSSFPNDQLPEEPQEMINYEFIQTSAYNEAKDNPQRRIESHTRKLLQQSITQILVILNQRSRPQRLQIDFNAFDYALMRSHPQYGIDLYVRLKLHFKQFGAQANHRQEWRMLRYRIPFESSEISFDYRMKTLVVDKDLNDVFFLDSQLSHSTIVRPPFTPLTSNFVETLPHFEMADQSNLPSLTLSLPEPMPTSTVHMIVPLSGRHDVFQRFLQRFIQLAHIDPFLYCVVVLFPDETNDNLALQSDYRSSRLLLRKQQKYFNDRLRWIDVSGRFSRANALHTAVQQLSSDSLLFFVDVDMLLNSRVLDRVRLNTRQGLSVYFPIVFSEYSPEFTDAQTGHVFHSKKKFRQIKDHPADLRSQIGYWRQYGFGIVSIFKSDLNAVGGLNLTIQGWGKEDVELYSACVQKAGLQVFRSPDPDLLHVHHDIHCKHSLEISQFEMCLGTKFSSLGEASRLAGRILEHNLLT